MTIYEPAEDSYFLQEYVKEYAFGRVLDMGTGSGIQALAIIKFPNVKDVVAVDIDEHAVAQLQQRITEQKIRKVKVLHSDLFEKVEGHFNLIIFNPPYLPQDAEIEDHAIYGGTKGWEVIERFCKSASAHLFSDGKILLLFSSLTHKEKVDEIISHQLFEFVQLGSKKLSFEELYVYALTKSSILRELEAKGIERIEYFTHGKRGNIFMGILDKNKLTKKHLPTLRHAQPHYKVKVAIKIKRQESNATLDEEAKWLELVNQHSIGPRLLFSGENYVVYEFVEGQYLPDWMKDKSKELIQKVLVNIVQQCLVLDQLHITKEEMHHPIKHILVDKMNRPVLIDFERCYTTDNPKNVTQFVDYICRLKPELERKGFRIKVEELRGLAATYKKDRDTFTLLRNSLMRC